WVEESTTKGILAMNDALDRNRCLVADRDLVASTAMSQRRTGRPNLEVPGMVQRSARAVLAIGVAASIVLVGRGAAHADTPPRSPVTTPTRVDIAALAADVGPRARALGFG